MTYLSEWAEYKEPFTLERGGESVGDLEGIKAARKGEVLFELGIDVRQGDWLINNISHKRFYVRDTDVLTDEGEPFARVAFVQTEDERRRAEREQEPTQQFTFNAPAYGIFGSQQDFTFEQVIHDLDRQIEEHGGEDTEELRQMVAEITEALETQDSISRSRFARWSELANKHAPWLLGPLGSLLVNYAFGPPGAG